MVGFPARPRLLVVTVVCAALMALTAACSTAFNVTHQNLMRYEYLVYSFGYLM